MQLVPPAQEDYQLNVFLAMTQPLHSLVDLVLVVVLLLYSLVLLLPQYYAKLLVLILLISLNAQLSLKDGVQDICGSILLHAHIAQTISKHVPEQPLQPDVGLELLLPPMLALILLLLLMLQEWILPSIAL